MSFSFNVGDLAIVGRAGKLLRRLKYRKQHDDEGLLVAEALEATRGRLRVELGYVNRSDFDIIPTFVDI